MPKSNPKRDNIYLDYASSAFSAVANPGAIHALGVKEKNKLEEARMTIAKILNAHPAEIIFTSGATESNNLAILGLIYPYLASPYSRGRKKEGVIPHIVTTNIEHASVLEVCKHLEKTGQAEVTFVPVEDNGIVDVKKIKKAIRANTVLVSVMYANNEIGTIQPIREIAKEVRHFRKMQSDLTRPNKIGHPLLIKERAGERCTVPYFHTDAVQAVNYLSMNVAELGVDMLSINSSKIYGPKGIGTLYIKKNTPVSKIMFGGEQEFGLRPGTENVALAAGFAKAMQVADKMKEKETERLTKLRDYFIDQLSKIAFVKVLGSPGPRTPARPFTKAIFANSMVNGDLKNRLPNNVNITISNIPSDLLVIELSERGIMASGKSACKAGDGKASHVIQAVNKNIKPARAGGDVDGSLRLTLGRETTKRDIDQTIKALSQILTKLKTWYY